jgi:hydrogenase maturation factor
MFEFLKTFHSHNRNLILLFLILAVLLSLIGFLAKKPWSKFNKITSLIAMIVMDVQFLIGMILYFGFSAFGIKAFTNENVNVMKDAYVREIAIEHFVLMLGAWVLIHVGYAKMKKSKVKNKTIFIFYTASLVLVLLGIPWERLG